MLASCAERPRWVGPEDPAIHYVGRFARDDAQGPTFAWAGSSIRVRFTGPSVAVMLRDLPGEPSDDPSTARPRNYYNVVLDDAAPLVIAGNAVPTLYRVASALTDGPHTLTVFKRTEPLVSISQFLGLELAPGGRLLAPEEPRRRALFIGDSITTGYGNEGDRAECPFTPETENNWEAFGAITARKLGAEYYAVAWSGRGVYRNHDGTLDETMSDLVFRVIPQDRGSERPGDDEAPDVIVVSLGGNDFATGDPGPLFKEHYGKLLSRLRAAYPSSRLIALVNSNMTNDWPPDVFERDKVRAALREIVAAMRDAGDRAVSVVELEPFAKDEPKGCMWHPSARMHNQIAEALAPAIQQIMKW